MCVSDCLIETAFQYITFHRCWTWPWGWLTKCKVPKSDLILWNAIESNTGSVLTQGMIICSKFAAFMNIVVFSPSAGVSILHNIFIYKVCHVTSLRPQDSTWWWNPVGVFITLRPRQNGRNFADDNFKRIFLNEIDRISIRVSLSFPGAQLIINQHRRPGAKPLSEAMMVIDHRHTHGVTRTQRVNTVVPMIFECNSR